MDSRDTQEVVAAKALGDAAFDQADHAAAASDYRKCLHLLNQGADNQIIALLQNLAIAHMQLQNPAESFMHAMTVLALFPNGIHPKACFHAAKAAAAMGLADAAKWLVEHVPVSSKAPAVIELAATLEASIGSKVKQPVLHSAELAYAILNASIQLPDPPPHSNTIHSAALTLPTDSEPKADEKNSTPPPSSSHAASQTRRLQLPAAAQSDAASTSASVAQLERAACLKEEGAASFKAGDAAGAVSKWSAALAELVILSATVPRLAAAEIGGQKGPQESHCAVACVALLWAPRTVSLHVARAKYATELCRKVDRSAPPLMPILCTEQALRMLPEPLSGSASELLRLHVAQQEPMRVYWLKARAAMAGQSTVERAHEMEAEGSGSHASGMAMKAMMQGLMASQPHKIAGLEKHAGPMPEDFDEAFFKSNPLPRGCSSEQGRGHLAIGAKDAYMQWLLLVTPALNMGAPGGRSASATRDFDGLDPLGGRRNPALTPGSLHKRFQGTNAGRYMHWWKHAPMGSVIWRPTSPYHDVCEKLQSFSNVQQHAFPLRPSSGRAHVHVGIGFVDLGHVAETLLDASRRGEELELEWFGFDASAHVCALTLIVAEMLKSGAPVDSIVQVWYSAAWSKATLQQFRHAIAALIDGHSGREQDGAGHSISREVRAWLLTWGAAEVPLKQARQKWLKRQLKSSAGIANACSRRDQHELCGYRLTGQLLDASTGSVPMFSQLEVPGKYFEYTDEEMVLDTIAPRTLLEAHRGLGHEGRTLIGAGLAVVRCRVGALQEAMKAGTLRVQVHHATVSAADQDSMSRIAALKPDSMSWSNVADYMQPQAFHHLARRCSLPRTRHFLHAMNWTKSVKGAFVLDYSEVPKSSTATVKRRCQIANKAYLELEANLQKVGGKGVFRHPVLDNRMNVADAMLARQMHQGWLQAFVRKCQVGTCASYEVLQEPEYWYFSRADTAVHFAVQYS